ncbi:MAG: Bug family tripartite tricarboxylate transporter substrate binding protein [Burkholderiaceae bacterium]
MKILKSLLVPLCSLMLAAAFPAAAAEPYPNKPIRLIVPYAAGGGTDVMARAFAQRLASALSVQIVVENRTGAGGNIAASAVAKAAPDGYTLFFGAAGPLAVNPALYDKLPFDPVKDFAPIGLVGSMALFLTVPASMPVKSVKDLVALAKAKPGQLNYASAGIGGTTHLAMEVLKTETGANLTHVPYKGTAAGVADMLGGNIQVIFDAWTSTSPHVESGKLKYLAVSTTARSAMAPQVPTMAESGFPGFNVFVWYGILAPAGTPSEVVDKLGRETLKVMAQPELKEAFARLGMEPMSGGPEPFAAFIRSETVKWAKIVRDAGAKAE